MADNQQYGPLAPKQTSASDIRSVIANATKTTGKGNTIATTNELEQKRAEKANQNSRAKGLTTKNFETTTKVNPNIAATNNTKATSVITSSPTTTEGKQKVTGPVANTITPQQVQDAFKNPQLQPINNVKVEQINGKTQEPKLSESYQNYSLNKNDIKKLVVESKDDVKKRQSEGVEKLYIDAYRKKKDGSALTIEDVLGNANYQKELKGIEQGVLQEMVNDANTLANAGKFDMDNAMALFEKYGDLGIQMDYSKLSPQTKAQFVGDMLNNNQSTLGKIISLVTPMGQLNYGIEKMTGKSLIDYANQGIEKLEKSSHKNLTDKEADKIAEKYIKELDEGFKDYYEMGKKSPSLVDYATNIKDAANMYYKHKYGVDEDQKIWKDKDKEREYNEKLNEIRSLVKEQHGDTAENTAKNALIGTAKGLLTVANMASDLPSFGKMILNLAGGGIEDTVGSVVSLGKTAYDTAKYAKDTGDFEVQWDAKDVRQRVAESGGYENYDDMVAKLEKEWGDNPLGQFAVWSLKNADTSMDTANALGNYFIEKYGSLDDGWTAFKNDPAEVISDWMPVMQFKVALLSKLGLISEAKAAQIINASRWLDVYDKPFELANKLQFGPLLKMEGKLLKGTGKTLGWTVKAPVKAVSNIVDTVMNQITGITKEDRKYIRENADSVLDYVNGKETSDGIINDIKERFDEVVDEKKQVGREYEKIKESNTPIKTNSIIDNIKDTLAEFGVKFGDNGVEYTKVLPTSIENKVKELYKYINDFQKKGETASAADTHYFRRLVDTLANWDNPNPKGLEADFINAVKEIRSSIDNVLKKEVPGMKQVDEAYSAAINTIKEFRQDWFNKDGTIKDTAYSKIRNLTNKGANQPKLERLEKLIPGVTEKLKSLAVAETIERATNATVGHYAKQIIGTGGSILGLTSLLTGGLSATGLVLGILGAAYATPKNFVHLLKWEGNLSKGIKDIIGKLEGKKKLTAKETSDLIKYVADNQEELKDAADYMSEKGLLEETTKASDTKAPKSKDPTLKELTEYKESLKKDLKDGKITQKYYDDEVHGKNGEPGIDYAIAQKKARAKAGDKEHVLSAEDKKRVTNFIKKRAKDVGFVTEMFEKLPFDEGFTSLREKIIAFSKKPGDTTAKHELFHAFFSVVDEKTKTYLIQEARKILKDNGMAIKDAEEWLAESFGIYAKRKMIDLGMIKNAPKGFVAKVRDFFQRVYEFMQRFNGDRATINKVFDEVLGDRQMKNGIIDLSDLLGDKEVKVRELGDNGLRKKAVYHGSPADFDKFDSSHMGEGEGAQAHGWGHYVAVEERTGKHYAEMGKNRLEYKGLDNEALTKEYYDLNKKGEYTNRMGEIAAAKAIFGEMEGGMSFSEAKKTIKDRLEKWTKDSNNGLWKKELEEIDNIKEGDIVKKSGRNLYSLDIPDPVKADTPTGKNYLEEKELMSADATKKFIEVFGKEYPTKVEQLKANIDSNGYGRGGRVEGWEMYVYLEDLLGSPKAASKFLESIGYDGIHYIGKRDGEAYVIFNDDALQIKDHIRYKKKTDSEGRELSDRQLKYFGNSKVRNDKGELVPVYHFTADDFNTVDFKKGSQNYFWFTSDKNASDRAMGVRPGMQKKRKDMYVDIKNPAGWDEYNKFGTDELKARGYDGVILKEKDGSFEGFIWDKENQVKYVDNQNPTRASKDMRFKKKIGDKDVEITPEADSPDQLIEKNADGLSVMKSFISEKQAEKALDVNKALLDKDGNAYLWTHTNKYSALPFTDFQNYGDSKYKEFANNEIAWVSNSESMSKSYSSDSTKLANTKAPRNDAEFKEYLKSLGTTDKGKSYTTEVEFNVKEGDGGYYVERLDKWDNTYDEEGFKDYAAFYGGMTRDAYDHLVNAMGGLDNAMKAFKERMDRNNYRNVIVERKDGKIHVHTELPSKDTPVYKDKQGLYANMYAQLQGYGKYHYQGIIQNMKNPLVVDLGKYPKGAFLTSNAADLGEKGRLWNDLGSAYDFLKKNSDIDIEATTKAIKDEFKKAVDNQDKIWNGDLLDKIEAERPERYMEYKKLKSEGDYEGAQKVEKWLLNLSYGGDKIRDLQYGIVEKLTPEEAMIKIGDTTLGELYKKSKKAYDKYSEIYDLWREAQSAYKKDYPIGGGVYGEKYKSLERKNLINYLKNKGFDAGALSMMLHNTNIGLDLGWLASYDLSEALKNKRLQTNDYVFYALNKGGYDGVVFKDIVDYGHSTENIQGGDVVAMFNSKQFKAWDNSNPTDSKYISYKKKVSLDKKQEGLSKKGSNGLLAKGRERTLGNNGMRYKKDIPEDKKLVGLHNLGIDKLRGVIELGGMPMPSIAVTKKGVPHESYGDITFIMKESAINPALSRKNKLYTVDGYTPTVPQPTIKVKDTKEANLLMDKIQKETGIGYGELMQWLEYHDDRYFKDYPKLKEFDKYYDQLTEKKLFDGFTYSGKRRYKDYNLDNIVKSMVGNKRDAFNGAFWKMVAQSQGNTTVEKLRDRKYGLKDKDLAEKMGEKYYDALKELASKKGIEQKIESLSDYGRFAENVSDAYRANTDAWWRELTQWDGAEGTIYSKITKEDLEPLQKIIKEAAELPRPYSEAKPERAIRFDEVGAVVAPEGKLKEVKDMLKDTGLKVYGYKEGERMSTIDKVADDNGLRFKKAYHGTAAKFDKFDSSHMSEGEGNQAHGWGHYVAVEPETAKKYAGLKERQSGGVYYNIDGKPYKEVYNSLSPFEKEAYDSFIALRNNDYDFEEAWDRIKKDKTEEINNGIKDMKAAIEYGKKYLLEEKLTPEQKERIKSFLESDKKRLENYEKQKKELHKIDELKARSDAGKYMYELDIPDPVKKDTPTGKNYLEEGDFADFKVRDKFIKLAEEHGLKRPSDFTSDEFIESKGGLKGAFEYEMNHRTVQNYGNMYDVLADYLGGQKEASKFLESLGYDGIHYFGEQDGEAYVLFKDESPKIKNTIRYKKGLTAKNQTQTPEFKKWFEGSKVVDKSGKPLEVYHNTDSDFTEFDINKTKTGLGHFFTSDKKYLNGLKNKMSVYLDIKNPLIANPNNKISKQFPELKKLMERPEESKNWSFDERVKYEQMLDKKFDKELRKILKREGYDGVFYEDEKGNVDQFVALDPSQIKSATDNIGTFDKNNPDIRYKKGLEKKKTSSIGRHLEDIDRIASKLGVKGDNAIQKIKKMNKVIKDPKYQGTKIKKELYDLKWEIKKNYIIDNNKKIKDRGFRKTTVKIWNGGESAEWHFTKKQYDELKKLGYIVK